MNKIITILTALAISTASFSTLAAEQIKAIDGSLEKVAVISVFGAGTPQELTEKLAQKADSIGASKFKIIMTASSDNHERGTAIAYK